MMRLCEVLNSIITTQSDQEKNYKKLQNAVIYQIKFITELVTLVSTRQMKQSVKSMHIYRSPSTCTNTLLLYYPTSNKMRLKTHHSGPKFSVCVSAAILLCIFTKIFLYVEKPVREKYLHTISQDKVQNCGPQDITIVGAFMLCLCFCYLESKV